MGAYRYKIKPSALVTTVGNLPDGFTLHKADYAFRPTNCGWINGDAEKLNNAWAFRSGVVSCRSAWKRKGGRPELVTTSDCSKIPETVSIKVLVPGTTNCYTGVDTPVAELEKPYEWGEVYVYPSGWDPATYIDDNLYATERWLLGTIWLYPAVDGAPATFSLKYRELDALDYDPLNELHIRKAA